MRLAVENEPKKAVGKVRLECDRLDSFLRAMKLLHTVAGDIKTETFDLAAVLYKVAEANSEEFNVIIDLAGPQPCLIVGSSDLVEIVADNALRNAIEANESAGRKSEPVVVSWSRNPDETWFTVLDAGNGPPANIRPPYQIGVTTKLDHFGAGLAFGQKVAARLGGHVSLERSAHGGGKFEMRWPSV
jgi:sensor histidine kinase regulating citrate/malate metabolism